MKKAEKHAEFLAEFAAELGYFYEIASSDIDRTSELLEWFGNKVFEHGYNHGVEDAESNKTHPPVHERDKTHTHVPVEWLASDGWNDGLEEGP